MSAEGFPGAGGFPRYQGGSLPRQEKQPRSRPRPVGASGAKRANPVGGRALTQRHCAMGHLTIHYLFRSPARERRFATKFPACRGAPAPDMPKPNTAPAPATSRVPVSGNIPAAPTKPTKNREAGGGRSPADADDARSETDDAPTDCLRHVSEAAQNTTPQQTPPQRQPGHNRTTTPQQTPPQRQPGHNRTTTPQQTPPQRQPGHNRTTTPQQTPPQRQPGSHNRTTTPQQTAPATSARLRWNHDASRDCPSDASASEKRAMSRHQRQHSREPAVALTQPGLARFFLGVGDGGAGGVSRGRSGLAL